VPDLDERLAATRTRLLDEIEMPDLAVIGRRAERLRRRRRAGRAGAAALAVVAAVFLAPIWQRSGGDGPGPEPPAARPEPTSAGPVYTDAGITVHGLDGVVVDLPGVLRDVEFADRDHGFVLGADCPDAPECRLVVAGTADGGDTWTTYPVTGHDAAPDRLPDVVALDETTLVLHSPGTSVISTDAGATWRPVTRSGATATLNDDDRPLLRPGPGAGCAGAAVEVWSPGLGHRGDLADPPLNVCWVAARRSADGGWWIGGTEPGTGRPAVAVTRDGGATWSVTDFDTPGDLARVGMLGDHTYAVVVTRDGQADLVRAVYHSPRPGAPFQRVYSGDGGPRTIGGEPVPLLDGRLLVVDGQRQWFLGDADGRSFTRAGDLPPVARVWRTPGGYVALDIVADGYAAFSPDGTLWRKLHVR